MSDSSLLDLPISRLENLEQAINTVEAHIRSYEQHLGAFPGPYDPVNGIPYILWERRAMIWLGRVSERIAVLRELGVLPPEQAERLKTAAFGVINRATAQMVMGGRQ